MYLDDYRVFLLGLCMWREARSEGSEGWRAVGHVVRNRVLEGRYKSQWVYNITAKYQFSSIGAPGDVQLTYWPQEDDKVFEQILLDAGKIYLGSDDDITQGSTEYRNPTFATSKSFQLAVDNGEFIPTVKLGAHQFYRRKTK